MKVEQKKKKKVPTRYIAWSSGKYLCFLEKRTNYQAFLFSLTLQLNSWGSSVGLHSRRNCVGWKRRRHCISRFFLLLSSQAKMIFPLCLVRMENLSHWRVYNHIWLSSSHCEWNRLYEWMTCLAYGTAARVTGKVPSQSFLRPQHG